MKLIHSIFRGRTALIAVVCLLTVLALFAAGCSAQKADGSQKPADAAAPTETTVHETAAPTEAAISEEQAKEIARTDAGLNADSVTFTETKLDVDNGVTVYEVEFRTAEAEYEYEIDAAIGKILSSEIKILAAEDPTSAPMEPTSPAPAAEAIGIERAKLIALRDAGLTDAKFTKAEEDTEDGKPVYELQFRTDKGEYDYEIDAFTGAILSQSFEPVKELQTVTPSTAYISLEEAKTIALQRAGLTADKATFSMAKLEKEDGRQVYEIEFYAGAKEYECTIDAVNGSILDYETEGVEQDDADDADDLDDDD